MAIDRVFNPEMLVLGRLAREMTQGDLARVANTSQARISKVEAGFSPPPDELVKRFAEVLDFPVEFFYQGGRIYGLPVRYHRRRLSLARKTLDRVHAEISIRTFHVAKLLRSATVESERGTPHLDIDDFEGSAADIARALRAQWQLPRGPIKNLIEVIEQAGIIVIPCDFGVPEVDAVGQTIEGLPPLMFVNAVLPTDRLRFTVAHELGHIVMHGLPNKRMEEQANEFAAEFLMPAEDIAHQLSRLTLPLLAALKPVWRVSMGGILRRARDLKKITDRQYRSLQVELARRNWRKREPAELDLSPEPPSLLSEIIAFHTGTLGYGLEELGALVHEHPERFRRMYHTRQGLLRLVG